MDATELRPMHKTVDSADGSRIARDILTLALVCCAIAGCEDVDEGASAARDVREPDQAAAIDWAEVEDASSLEASDGAMISGKPPELTFTVGGSEQTVCSWANDRCSNGDIPDAAARAFRDSKGKVHLFASSALNLPMVGPDLDHVVKNCTAAYTAGGEADPSKFDDLGWLESFYTPDGVSVFALVSMDYHPDRHGLPCGASTAEAGKCWYGSLVAATSTNGGSTFTSPPVGNARFVSGPTRRFDSAITQTAGTLVPSNVVRYGKAFYVLVSVVADGAQTKGGECLLRTTDLSDVRGWRAWDGADFTVSYVSPYDGPAAGQNVCTPLPTIARSPVRSLATLGDGFVLITNDSAGVIAQTSIDLVHWTSPVRVMDIAIYIPNSGSAGDYAYGYPALIDNNSPSISFDAIGSSAYLYFTKYQYGGGLNRDLVRYRINITQN